MSTQVEESKPVLPGLMTAEQVCKYLQISRALLGRLTKAGKIVATHVGPRGIRYARVEVERYCRDGYQRDDGSGS